MPYMKNVDMLNDPLATAESPPAGFPPALWNAAYPQFGINWVVWSSVSSTTYPGIGTCAAPWITAPATSTSIGRPADVPLFVSKPTTREEGGSGGWWSYGGPGNIYSPVIVDPPDCNTIIEWCFGNWGNGGNWSAILSNGGAEIGRYTGGNTRRRALNHVVIFGDGHASAQKAGKMAVGTNFQDSPTWAGSGLIVTNPAVYRWNKQ
jgi:hypothetical protein